LSRPEAVRAARLETGNVTSVTQEVRSYGWENAVDNLRADLRFAARRLRSEPGFTAVAAITLAVGIGATTAILSAVNPVLFQPLPYPDAGRIVALSDAGNDGSRVPLTFGTYREVETRTRSFEALAVYKPWQPTLQGGAVPDAWMDSASVPRSSALGVTPAQGGTCNRPMTSRAPDVVLLSDGLWHRASAPIPPSSGG
jgi:hypothetical protein